uniref:Transposase n=1 Tax=Ditylenchus dipsaci TaxID=166011 RepID=A0A915D8L5_9BILA
MINSDVVDMLGVEEEESEIKQSRKLNSYNSAYKLEAIKHAKRVSSHSDSTKFHVDHSEASEEWLYKFIARHDFRLRVPTTVCQKASKEYAQKGIAWMLNGDRMEWTANGYGYGCLFGLDLHFMSSLGCNTRRDDP